jgi:hypothetical protein
VGAAGTAVTGPGAPSGWSVDGSSAGDRRGVVADEDRDAVAGSAALLRELENGLQPASSLGDRRVWARLLDQVRRGCDQAEGLDWTVAVDGTVVRAHQHAAGARHRSPADVHTTQADTGGSVE